MSNEQFYNNFEFIGEAMFPKEEKKIMEVKKFDSKWERHKLSMAIKESDTNAVFLELSSMFKEGQPIRTYSKDNKQIEVTSTDRNKQSTLNIVADYKKFIVDLETDQELKEEYIKLYFKIKVIENKKRKGEANEEDLQKLKDYQKEYNEKAANRHEFITEYDMVKFIHKNIEVFKTHKFKVKGSIEMSEWKGNYYTKYIPNHFEIVSNDEPSMLLGKVDIFFNHNAIDESAFDETKKIFIEGYLKNYDKAAKENRYFSKMFILNGSKLDLENELHVNRFNWLKDQFKTDKDTYQHLTWKTTIYRGAEKKEFTYEDLTQKQKEMVDLGLANLESFAPRGGVLGQTVDEFRLFTPIFEKDYKDGALDTQLNDEEFYNLIAKNTEDVKLSDMKKDKVEETETVKKETNLEENSLTEDLNKLFM